MGERLKYIEIAPEGYEAMRALEHYLNTGTGLPSTLQEFARLLASEINGCEYCIHMHTTQLKKVNETDARIAGVKDWRTSDLYTLRERAALAWTEAVTNIQDGHAPDPVYNELKGHFTDFEIVNLTLTITNINSWNRLQIALGEHSSRA